MVYTDFKKLNSTTPSWATRSLLKKSVKGKFFRKYFERGEGGGSEGKDLRCIGEERKGYEGTKSREKRASPNEDDDRIDAVHYRN